MWKIPAIRKKEFMKATTLKENVGVDISMNDFSVSFTTLKSDLSVRVKGTKNFPNNQSGYIALEEWVAKKTSGDCPVSFTMEATGVYYEGAAYYLFEQGYTVYVVLPNQVKKYGQSLGIKSKTDKIDAGTLARMGMERKLSEWKPFSPCFRTLKCLTRERDTMINERTEALNRLHAYLHQNCPPPGCIERAKRLIAFYDEQIQEIDSQIKQVVDSDKALAHRLAYVCSIKGVGFVTAVVVVAETNGFATFRNIKQLTSFAGLDVRIRESGNWKGKSRISKCGNRHIRKAMFWPAFSKIRNDEKTKEFYERIVEKKTVKMVAAVAVQRKLLGLMYTLWKKQEMFDASA